MYGDAWSACRCLPCASSYHCKPRGAHGVWVVSVLSRMAVSLCMYSECACACAHSQKEETPAVPGVGLLQRTIPPSVLG